MTVTYHAPGQNSGNFYGFKVSVSMGGDGLYQVECFSLSKNRDRATVAKAAHAENERLEAIRDRIIQEDWLYKVPSNNGPEIIAPGFRANLSVSPGKHFKCVRPAFTIERTLNGRRRPIALSIGSTGLQATFEDAVKRYCSVHNLCAADEAVLLTRNPQRELFTEYLVSRGIENGSLVEEEASQVDDRLKNEPTSNMPAFHDYKKAIELARSCGAHIKFYCDHLFIFKRVSIEERFIATYSIHDYGSLCLALMVAMQDYRLYCIHRERENADGRIKHPADFVRFSYDRTKDRGSYAVRHPNVDLKTFTFRMSSINGDLQLRAYRSALQYAAHAVYLSEQLEVTDWRHTNLYESYHSHL